MVSSLKPRTIPGAGTDPVNRPPDTSDFWNPHAFGTKRAHLPERPKAELVAGAEPDQQGGAVVARQVPERDAWTSHVVAPSPKSGTTSDSKKKRGKRQNTAPAISAGPK